MPEPVKSERSRPPGKFRLVVSDLHLGTGIPRGRPNPMEDFASDRELADLLEYYSTGTFEDAEVKLFLNGDIFDFLKVSVEGQFTDRINERVAVVKLRKCLEGHPVVVEAFKEFVSIDGKDIVYVPGNHDMDMMFSGTQATFREALGVSNNSDKVTFVEEPYYYDRQEGIQIHHGHQFDPVQRYDFSRIFVPDRGVPGEKILNLPWGCHYVINVVTRFKAERPHVDRVSPFSLMVLWGFLFDFRFAVRLFFLSMYYFIRTRLLKGRHYRSKLSRTFQILRKELSMYPRLEKFADGLLRGSYKTRVVVFGHTHGAMVRTMEGGIYINTGTWVPAISLDVANLGRYHRLTYCLIDFPDGEAQGHLLEWTGHNRPYRELRC